jgi:hypothetical protein
MTSPAAHRGRDVNAQSNPWAMFRELDQRKADQMTVTPEWDPATGHLQVRCEADRLPNESFCYAVDPREAALAFKHRCAMRPASLDRDRSDESRDPGTAGPTEPRGITAGCRG